MAALQPTIAEQRLPTKSSVLLSDLFNLTSTDFSKPIRDVAELQTPKTQGVTTKELAEFIIKKGQTNNPNLKQAKSFIKHYNSGKCYICGVSISTDNNVEELEHKVPIVEGLSVEIINQLNMRDSRKRFDDIYNTDEALGYLLEYARSHRCCNQLKGNMSPFTFDGIPTLDGMTTPYKININGISTLLKNIWENIRNIPGRVYQDETGCKQHMIVSQFRTIKKDEFIKARKKELIEEHFQPLLDFFYKKISEYGRGSFGLAQLVMISNQAMGIDQSVWGKLGISWTGNILNPSDFLFTLHSQLELEVNYSNSRKTAIEKLYTKTELKTKCFPYYDDRRKDGRTTRSVSLELSTLSRMINVDYLELLNMIKSYFKHYGENMI